MTHDALIDAERMAFTYAEQLAGDIEATMRDHELVAKCWGLEDQLTILNTLLGLVIQFGAKGFAAMPRPLPPEAVEHERRAADSLRRLSQACGRIDEAIGWYEGQRLNVEGASEFRDKWGKVDTLARVATGPEANPRPVAVDDSGHIFDLDTGERIVMPGLEPEAIRQGLADRVAGRFRTLPRPSGAPN